MRKQIAFYKEARSVFQYGTFYRLLSPFVGGGHTAWISVAPDQKTAYAGYYQTLTEVNQRGFRLRLAGLCPAQKYRVRAPYYDREHFGDELMNAGLLIDRRILQHLGGDFASILFEIKAC